MPPNPCVKAPKVLTKKSTRTAADGSLSILFHTLPPEPGTEEKKGTVCATKSLLPVDPKRDPSRAEGFRHCLYTELAKSSLQARRRHRDAPVSGRDRQAGRNLKERNKNDQGLEGLIY